MEGSTRPPSLDEKGVNHKSATHATDEKKKAILEACSQRDLDALRALAQSPGGFLADSIRQRACKCYRGATLPALKPIVSGLHFAHSDVGPVLLGLPPDNAKTESSSDGTASGPAWESLPRHRDEDQVQLDVNRSFIYYPERMLL